MRWGGVTLLLFVVWHLLNFTIVKVNVAGGPTNDPYNLLVDSFDLWWMTLIYLVAMVALGMHLHHGVWSAAQTLGLTNNARARRTSSGRGIVLAVVIAVGFSLVPIFVLAGVISVTRASSPLADMPDTTNCRRPLAHPRPGRRGERRRRRLLRRR